MIGSVKPKETSEGLDPEQPVNEPISNENAKHTANVFFTIIPPMLTI
jgi:hypothetical protein